MAAKKKRYYIAGETLALESRNWAKLFQKSTGKKTF